MYCSMDEAKALLSSKSTPGWLLVVITLQCARIRACQLKMNSRCDEQHPVTHQLRLLLPLGQQLVLGTQHPFRINHRPAAAAPPPPPQQHSRAQCCTALRSAQVRRAPSRPPTPWPPTSGHTGQKQQSVTCLCRSYSAIRCCQAASISSDGTRQH